MLIPFTDLRIFSGILERRICSLISSVSKQITLLSNCYIRTSSIHDFALIFLGRKKLGRDNYSLEWIGTSEGIANKAIKLVK